MTVLLRLDEKTRDRVLALARDLGGVSADEAVRHLLDERWERRAIEAVHRYAQEDLAGYDAYIADAGHLDRASAPVADTWDDAA
jgi:hypothetical protein